jgi:hypothetical protein
MDTVGQARQAETFHLDAIQNDLLRIDGWRNSLEKISAARRQR